MRLFTLGLALSFFFQCSQVFADLAACEDLLEKPLSYKVEKPFDVRHAERQVRELFASARMNPQGVVAPPEVTRFMARVIVLTRRALSRYKGPSSLGVIGSPFFGDPVTWLKALEGLVPVDTVTLLELEIATKSLQVDGMAFSEVHSGYWVGKVLELAQKEGLNEANIALACAALHVSEASEDSKESDTRLDSLALIYEGFREGAGREGLGVAVEPMALGGVLPSKAVYREVVAELLARYKVIAAETYVNPVTGRLEKINLTRLREIERLYKEITGIAEPMMKVVMFNTGKKDPALVAAIQRWTTRKLEESRAARNARPATVSAPVTETPKPEKPSSRIRTVPCPIGGTSFSRELKGAGAAEMKRSLGAMGRALVDSKLAKIYAYLRNPLYIGSDYLFDVLVLSGDRGSAGEVGEKLVEWLVMSLDFVKTTTVDCGFKRFQGMTAATLWHGIKDHAGNENQIVVLKDFDKMDPAYQRETFEVLNKHFKGLGSKAGTLKVIFTTGDYDWEALPASYDFVRSTHVPL